MKKNDKVMVENCIITRIRGFLKSSNQFTNLFLLMDTYILTKKRRLE